MHKLLNWVTQLWRKPSEVPAKPRSVLEVMKDVPESAPETIPLESDLHTPIEDPVPETSPEAQPAVESVVQYFDPRKTGPRAQQLRGAPLGRPKAQYDPTRNTVWPIDLNSKTIEAFDAICLLAGADWDGTKWLIGDVELDRNRLAAMDPQELQILGQHSLLTMWTRPVPDPRNNRELLHDLTEHYQKTLVDLLDTQHTSQVEIGDVVMIKGISHMRMKVRKGLPTEFYHPSQRLALLGPNLQLRYVLDVTSSNVETNTVTAAVRGLHTRAVRSRDMMVIRI